MKQASLLVLATGGTIAGQAGSAIRRDYRPGQIPIEEFLDAVNALGLPMHLSGRQIANIDSADIGIAVWRELHSACVHAMADPECDGIIITHGTDTAEETAFLLDQTLPTNKPIVLVGAMQPANAVGSDGLRNFANAMQVAAHSNASGRGVLLVMGDQVFAARDARKARTNGANAFAGFPRGPIALATPSTLEWLSQPWRSNEAARYALPEEMPEVPILHSYAGMSAEEAGRLCAPSTRGIVLAGMGDGNAPSGVRDLLDEKARSALLVVRATRVDEGLVERTAEDQTNGIIAARALGPAKARILLQLLIAGGVNDPAAVQAAFDSR